MHRSSLLKLVGLAASVAFAGCSDVTISAPPVPTKLVYSPANGTIPLPNDLLFKDTVDATLNFPPASVSAQQPLFDALNSLDGWSTTAPMSFAFDEAIDSATVIPGTTVRVFECTAFTAANGLAIGTPLIDVVAELTSPAQYVVSPTSTSTFAISPTAPLKPKTAYMVVITNGVLDADGDAVGPDNEYVLGKVDVVADPYPSGHPFEGLQVLVNAMENLAAADADVTPLIPRADVVVAFQFTTQDTTTVLGTARTIAAGGEAAVLAAIGAQFGAGHPANTDTPANTVPSATVTSASISATLGTQGDLYVGALTLPYYLTAATNAGATLVTDADPLTEFWHARYAFPFGVDTESNVSRYNPLPIQSGAEIVPMLISLPDAVITGLTKPAAGWPTVIFQHGITSNRTAVLGIADALNAAGYGVVAIDLPLHGIPDLAADPLGGLLFDGYVSGGVRERTFGLDNINNSTSAPGADTNADGSGAHFINLSSLRTQRDNLRQAAADLFALHKVLAADLDVTGGGGADLDPDEIHFIGHSLGSIVGVPFAALEPTLDTVTLGVPGAGIPRLLEASASFGPVIVNGLGAAGIAQGTPAFDQFMWAAQTTIETGDPLNYAAALLATTTPIFAQEVVGDGTVDDLFGLPDQVIPNSVAIAPLSGTEPLLTLLGLSSVTGAGVSTTAAGAARFTQGAHQSLLTSAPDVNGDGTPDADGSMTAAFAEMQSQVISWLVSNGASITVTDATVVQ